MKKKMIIIMISVCCMMLLFSSFAFAQDSDNSNVGENSALDNEKNELYDSMLNSVDNYNTVQGSCKIKFSKSETEYNIQYNVDFTANYSTENVISTNDDIETIANDKSVTLYDNNEKIFYQNTRAVDSFDPVASMDSQSRHQIDNGSNVWYYRYDPTGFSYAKQSLFPQERAFGFLSNQDLWDIEKSDVILSRDVWVVAGHLTGLYSEKLGVSNYQMWIDKETGCLLKYEGYNACNEKIEYLDTLNIEFDILIAISYIEKNKDGYRDGVKESLKEMGLLNE